MTDISATMAILGVGLCIPDETVAEQLGITGVALDVSTPLKPMDRRRASVATRVATTAADQACQAASVAPTLPTIFSSSVGEIQTTDKLCRAIARKDYPLSPTQFHNSVHNTAAGYWSMATGNTAAMQAMGAMDDGFALALLEAWCQLQTISTRVLLVVYDETIPTKLLPNNNWTTCAFALVLDRNGNDRPLLYQPVQASLPVSTISTPAFAIQNPALACISVFQALQKNESGRHHLNLSGGKKRWVIDLEIP
ncbi:beta-ketoacyl synthase chain length factor [Gammaproteobacteria bacterium]|nr:beta-ketoacyl synthase chain length factor [Gammaproteobacteria bacterium]